MSIQLFGCKIRLEFTFFLVLAVFLAADKTGLGILMVVAVLFHELGHLSVMVLLRLKITSIAFTPFGVKIEKEPLLRTGVVGECLLYLAGPLVNLILAGVFIWCYPRSFRRDMFSAINLVMAIFNLLPIACLDGGNIIRTLLGKRMGLEKMERLSNVISVATLIPLFGAACILILNGSGNFTLMVTCFYLAMLVVYQ